MAKQNKSIKKKIAHTISQLKAANKRAKRAKKEYEKAVEDCIEKNKGLRANLRNAKSKKRKLKRAYKDLKKELAASMQKEEQTKKKKPTAKKTASKKKGSPNKAAKKVNAIKAKAKHTRAKAPKRVSTTKTEKTLENLVATPAKAVSPIDNGKTPPSRPAPKKTPPLSRPPSRTNDNLKVIEGIGPAIERHLKAAGIHTFGQLARTSAQRISEILIERGGIRYAMHKPDSWAQQARLAMAGKLEELKQLQQELKGGKK